MVFKITATANFKISISTKQSIASLYRILNPHKPVDIIVYECLYLLLPFCLICSL